MAIKVIREPSETPNVTSKDDFRIINAAFNGQRGILLTKGTQNCSVGVGSNSIVVGSGIIIVDGVDIAIDSNEIIPIEVIDELRYYSVYVEVNFSEMPAKASVKVKAVYDTVGYPKVEYGDNLISKPNGIANVLLAHIQIQNGNFKGREDVPCFVVTEESLNPDPNLNTNLFRSSMLLNNSVGLRRYSEGNRAISININDTMKEVTLSNMSDEMLKVFDNPQIILYGISNVRFAIYGKPNLFPSGELASYVDCIFEPINYKNIKIMKERNTLTFDYDAEIKGNFDGHEINGSGYVSLTLTLAKKESGQNKQFEYKYTYTPSAISVNGYLTYFKRDKNEYVVEYIRSAKLTRISQQSSGKVLFLG